MGACVHPCTLIEELTGHIFAKTCHPLPHGQVVISDPLFAVTSQNVLVWPFHLIFSKTSTWPPLWDFNFGSEPVLLLYCNSLILSFTNCWIDTFF